MCIENYKDESCCSQTFKRWTICFLEERGGGVGLRINMGLINKVDMVCLSPMGYGV